MHAVILFILLQQPAEGLRGGFGPSAAESEVIEWRVGARLNIWSAFGEPANDIIGGSLYGARRLSKAWWLSAELYAGVFDFENPGDQVLGTSGTPTADAKIDMQIASIAAEWHFLETDDPFDLYVGAGLGIVLLGDGDAQSLPTVDVEVTGGTGVEAHLVFGASYRLAGQVRVTAELRVMEVFASLDVEDRLTGASDSLDAWETAGISLGLEIRF